MGVGYKDSVYALALVPVKTLDIGEELRLFKLGYGFAAENPMLLKRSTLRDIIISLFG